MRSLPAPFGTNNIVRDWKRACDEVCHHRTIQRCFMRALRQDADDGTMKDATICDWYVDSEDEQDTTTQYDSSK
eukprot:UN12919